MVRLCLVKISSTRNVNSQKLDIKCSRCTSVEVKLSPSLGRQFAGGKTAREPERIQGKLLSNSHVQVHEHSTKIE